MKRPSTHRCDGTEMENFLVALVRLAEHHRTQHGGAEAGATTADLALEFMTRFSDPQDPMCVMFLEGLKVTFDKLGFPDSLSNTTRAGQHMGPRDPQNPDRRN